MGAFHQPVLAVCAPSCLEKRLCIVWTQAREPELFEQVLEDGQGLRVAEPGAHAAAEDDGHADADRASVGDAVVRHGFDRVPDGVSEVEERARRPRTRPPRRCRA